MNAADTFGGCPNQLFAKLRQPDFPILLSAAELELSVRFKHENAVS